MNLLQLLLGSLTSDNSVNSLAKKTGISSKLVSKLIVMAVPLLIKYMTKNASTTSGAQSLLSALTKHNGTRSMSEQIDEVDEEDGQKILGHILGNDKEQVFTTLAKETGLQTNEVSKGLGALAPALLTGLAAATTSAAKPSSNGLDLGDLLGMFGGNQNAASTGLNMLGSLLGGAQPQQQQQQPTSLLGSLFGGNKPQQQAQPQQPTSLLSGLFGGQPQQQAQPASQLDSLMGLLGAGQQQPTQSSIDGSDLLAALTSLMK